jgi:hypothetical protein
VPNAGYRYRLGAEGEMTMLRRVPPAAAMLTTAVRAN